MRTSFHLLKPEEYHYINQMTKKSHKFAWDNCYESELDCFTVEGEDLKHDFERLQLAMEMVGFLPATRKQIFSLLSAILHLGNIRYKKKTYRDDSIDICNPEVLPIVSELLEVKEEMLLEALTTRKTVTVGERLIVPYRLAEAGTVRDSMAKSLYSALFDWIVFRTNHALLNNRDLEDNSKILSIGVLDIFGFEDYENNSFEQFCINFANERLQHYFNQHIFKLEQEEYRAEGITWHNIDYIDNSGCINLISKKPTALFHLLDEECNFPQASNQTLLDKFKRQHEGNSYIEFPAVMEPAFIIRHYAGKVKYGVKDFREKNTDHMRPDIVALLKSSKNAFICGLMGIDPVATFRWAVLRAYFRALVAFREAGRRHTKKAVNNSTVPCAVVKTVDSFSFLHHPVHQRSLEILQRCKDEKYSITRKNPRTPLSDLQGTNALNEKASWDGYSVGCNGRSSRAARMSSSGSPVLEEDGIFLNSTNSKLLERAQGILLRNKNCKIKPVLPKHLLDVKSLRYLSSVTLHDRITKSLLHLHKKKKPPSISAQFQASLNKLMETLDQSEPYFVKCIRSNAEKLPLRFSDSLVLRQLRYTGMLETVCIRQSGYSNKYTFQDFVHHFRVLLPRGTNPTKSSIRDFFRRIHLPPAGYQVGHTMVFLREAERQRLQTLLHQEVLQRIVMLQRRFRAALERKHFVAMRGAACAIQRWWRSCLLRQSDVDRAIEEEAAVCLQTAWKSYVYRRRFLQWREAATVIQRSWRNHCHCRSMAATIVQAGWRGFRERSRYHKIYRTVTQIQAMSRGYLARLRFRELKKQLECQILGPPGEMEDAERMVTLQAEPVKDLCLSGLESFVQDVSREPSGYSKGDLEDFGEMDKEEDSEQSRSIDETCHKNRSKRESRRMRELEQAQFSLDLLKVRTTIVGGPQLEGPEPGSGTSQLDDDHRCSPASHESFEVLSIEEMETDASSGGFSSQPAGPLMLQECSSLFQSETAVGEKLRDSNFNEKPMVEKQNKVEAPQATFYIASDQSPVQEPKFKSPSKSHKERREFTSRRPVVVLISMQKESPVEVKEPLAGQTLEGAPESGVALCGSQMIPIAGLEVGAEKEQPHGIMTQTKRDKFGVDKPPLATCGSSAELEGTCSSEVDIQHLHEATTVIHREQERRSIRPAQESRSPVLETKPPKAKKKSSTQTVTVNMVEKPSNTIFSPPRRKLPFSKSDKDLMNQERLYRDDGSSSKSRNRETSHKDQKKIHKTMSSGDLGKVEVLRKTSSHDGRMRGKMHFWRRSKHGEKKLSREKNTSRSEVEETYEGPSPPHSPDLESSSSRVVRDSKENKEPSPKIKRRRSVKISSITLEPAQWQNDALHILTSAHDYRSMNDFLMKKIADLDSEDSKKDTMVDVVFKKALKEFRINIFNSYSTALAMDDGKSIRYKDLYALFEHILEKTMRLEQRDWSESPVKVWVNTFKVFLDEFMTEYKPMEGTVGRAPKRERKKTRKKETDIVEEHNGHIFKSTQYSIPTYCEYCSSLIWMMDRACVCKLCRYACHRKCCSKMTTKCSKKYDPELSSRQFGVELSRLTSEERTVPQVVEKLINYIEMHGLYTEGIYRKSGSTNKIKELRQGLDTDVSTVILDDYNIHVIASVLKQWLRDLPSPLMTFELYEEFLRAMGQPDNREVIRGVYSVIDQLSRTHLSTLERLIFHLVRITLQEETNRMSANALAIVFAPCILRCPDTIDPLQSVQDISKTTACVELIINEQMSKYKARLKDISSLEFAESKAKSRLTHIRRSMPSTAKIKNKGRARQSGTHMSSPPLSPRAPPAVDGEGAGGSAGEDAAEAGLSDQQQLAMQQEERILTEQIENLQKEKEELTYEMLILEPRASDDETPESEASIGTADSSENIAKEMQGATFDLSERSTYRSRKSEAKDRRALHRQPDSQDSADSTSTVSSSYHPSSSLSSNTSGSPSPHYRFRSSSSGPLLTSCGLGAPLAEVERGHREGKTRHRIRLSRSSPREPSGAHRRESDFSSTPQQLVLYGSNEFMV
ncbi:unconventional myosin-IXa-like isoform X3 [Thalassophryne amazonica]|uniref:unconventional myosin-IXa-like isoform X3 n=1 Tax=Thalassophryne amazonica TaxID=390379 RepID=UPI0014717FF2|nr:unconventional myosin-IXa-like isoform X3 [Thalassophryne amazonica]